MEFIYEYQFYYILNAIMSFFSYENSKQIGYSPEWFSTLEIFCL